MARLWSMVAGARLAHRGVPDITPDALRALLAQGATLVDVRESVERAISIIPGAISAEAFAGRPARDRSRPVVAYCTVGVRSRAWAKARRVEGWDARNLAGSILAWTHAGGDLVTPDGHPTRRVHVYGPAWNVAAPGYEAVWDLPSVGREPLHVGDAVPDLDPIVGAQGALSKRGAILPDPVGAAGVDGVERAVGLHDDEVDP